MMKDVNFMDALFFIGVTSIICGTMGLGFGVIILYLADLTGGWLWTYFPLATGFIGILVGPYLYWENEIYDWIMK